MSTSSNIRKSLTISTASNDNSPMTPVTPFTPVTFGGLSESRIRSRVRFIKERMLLLVDLGGIVLTCIQDVNIMQQALQEAIGVHMKELLQNAQRRQIDLYGKAYFPAITSSTALRQQQQYQMDCYVCYDNFRYENVDLWNRFQHVMTYLQQQFSFRRIEEFTTRLSFEEQIGDLINDTIFNSRSLSPPRSCSLLNILSSHHGRSDTHTSCNDSVGSSAFIDGSKNGSDDVKRNDSDSSETTGNVQSIDLLPTTPKHVIEYHSRYFITANTKPTTSSSPSPHTEEKGMKVFNFDEVYLLIDGRFVLDKVLSKGTYGTVYKGRDTHTQRNVAVKELDLEMMDKIGAIEFAQREVEIMKIIKDNPHPHIVNSIDVIEEYETISIGGVNRADAPLVYIITEFCERGALENPYEEHEQHEEEDVQRYFVQIISAVEHMHNVLSILHRDLTLSNVCLDADGNVKIVDFGLSDKFEKGKKYHRLFVGNGGYCCPELLLKKCYAEEIDIYAIGVMLYKLLTGYLPFRTAQDKFSMNFYIPLDEESFSDSAKEVIVNLLEVNLANRWKLEDVKRSAWCTEGFKKWNPASAGCR